MILDNYIINKNNVFFGSLLVLVGIIILVIFTPMIFNAGKDEDRYLVVTARVVSAEKNKIEVSYEAENGVIRNGTLANTNNYKVHDKVEIFYDKWDSTKIGIVGSIDTTVLIILIIVLVPLFGFCTFIFYKEWCKLKRLKDFKKDATLIEVEFIDLLNNSNLVMCKGHHPVFLMEYNFNWDRFSDRQLEKIRSGKVKKLKVWVDNYNADRYLFEKI